MVNLKTQIKRNKLAVSVAAALALSISSGVFAAESEAINVDIEKNNVTSSLLSLSSLSGVQIMIGENVDKSLQLPGIKGSYQLSEALNQMLEGTGLVYEFVSDDSVVIKATAEDESSDGADDVDEEVVITGSRLRNVSPTSPVVTITREDMDKQGLVTAADVVRSLPQNFSSVNTATTTLNRGELGSFSLGTASADLRGLGPDATLILVNGRRVAASPVFEGQQVNLNSIPAAAIERVEVMLDGASAIYGSDAIAGVINFILRDDYVGATTKVRYENSAHGADSRSLSQTLGWTWDSGNALIAFEYSDSDGVDSRKAGFVSTDLTSRGGADWRRGLTSSPGTPAPIFESFFGFFPGAPIGVLPDSFDGTEAWTEADLLPITERYDTQAGRVNSTPTSETLSLTVSLKQDFSDSISGFADILYSDSEYEALTGDQSSSVLVPASNPFNQLGREVFVNPLLQSVDTLTLSESKRLNVSAGLEIDLPNDWILQLVGNYGTEERQGSNLLYDFEAAAATENLFGNNIAINPDFLMNDITDSPLVDSMSVEVSANGNLFSIAGGDVALAVGLNYRPEKLDYSDASLLANTSGAASNVLKLDSQAYFFEASVPLVGDGNALPGIQSFLVTLAGRYEDYEFDGQFVVDGPQETKSFDKFSPRVGFRWDINDELWVRGSWGESFKAPSLRDLFGLTRYSAFFGTFPVFDPRNQVDTQAIFGSGGNPSLTPETSTTRTIGFEYAPSFLEGLTLSTTYTDIEWDNKIERVRGFDVGSVGSSAIADSLGLLDYDVSVADGGDGDSTTLDAWPTRPANLASRISESVDASVDYSFGTDVGQFDMGVTAVWTLELEDQLTASSPLIERVGTEQGPDDLVMKAYISWSRDNYGANLYARYSSSYDNDVATFNNETVDKRVEHYVSYDLTGFYEMDNGLKFRGGLLNVTNQQFPFFDNENSSYDARRVDPRGRVIYVELSKEFEI